MSDRRKLQVFVSSTYTDLIEERQAAVSAILKAGHIPAGMELFTSGDKSQLEVIKRWIDESDVYMLILGTRYGSIEPETSLGYTEVEYDYAVASGKPFFALVIDESAIDPKIRAGGKAVTELKSPDKLAAFREKVMSRICSLYTDERDIKSYIYESLIELSRDKSLEGWVRGGLVTEVKPLYDQISDLKGMNEKLQTEIASLRGKQSIETVDSRDNEQFITVRDVLKAIKITVPAEISKSGEETETDAFRLFVLNKNIYIRGISVAASANAKFQWWEKNAYAVYITHRLMLMDRKADGQKLYSMSERGLDFSAWLDTQSLTPSDA